MKFIYALVFALSYLSVAQSTLDVKALDASRNCWYTEFEETQMIQIADFGGFDPRAYRFHKDDLKERITESIRERSSQKNLSIDMSGAYKVHLLCSALGHSLVVNSFESHPAFIYSAKLGQLNEGEFALNDQASKGFTSGSSIHTFIVKRSQYISSQEYIRVLKNFLPNVIASARFIRNSDSGSIRVLPQYYFKTAEVMELIQSHRVLRHYTKRLEYSTPIDTIGESGALLDGIF